MSVVATAAKPAVGAEAAKPQPPPAIERSLAQRLASWLPPLIGVLLFALAIWVIHRELAAFRPGDLMAELASIPAGALALAVLAAAAGYGTLTLFDPLALHYLGKHLPYRQTALASFTGYAFGHNLGFSWLSGGAVRYRLYTVWGLSSLDIGTIIAFNSVSTFLGLSSILALACLGEPAAVGHLLHLPSPLVVAIGVVLLVPIAGYLVAAALQAGADPDRPLAADPAAAGGRCGAARSVAARLDARGGGPLRPAAGRPAARLPGLRRPVRARQSRRVDQQCPGRDRRVRGGRAAGGARRRCVRQRRGGADRLPGDLLSSTARRGGRAARRPPAPGQGDASAGGSATGPGPRCPTCSR